MEVEVADTNLFVATVGVDSGDTDRSRPVLLTFPPGRQDWAVTQGVFDVTIAREARRRGWVAFSPAAPDGVLFFEGAERVVGGLLDWITERVAVEGQRIHLAGMSNGGISCFRAAVQHPERIASVVAFPGYAAESDRDLLPRLSAIPVGMFVGKHDPAWLKPMRETARVLEKAGGSVQFEVIPGETHVLTRFSDGHRLFDVLDQYRIDCS